MNKTVLKAVLLIIIFVLESTTVCYADIYAGPTEGIVYAYPVLGILLVILGVLLLIGLFCMFLAKLHEQPVLLDKCKKICENLFFYIGVNIGLLSALFPIIILDYGIWGILPLIAVLASLFLRLKYKKKKAAYIVLGIYLGVILLIYYYHTCLF